jgi:hypothetical protein
MEDMDDHRSVIEQNPLTMFDALAVEETSTLGSKRLVDRVGDGLDLPRRVTRTDHEKIGDRG